MTSTENGNGRRVVLNSDTLIPISKVLGGLVLFVGAIMWITNIAANVRQNTASDREILQRYTSLESQIESVRSELRTALGSLGSKQEVDLMIRAAVSEANAPIHRQLGEIMGRIKAIEERQGSKGGSE